MGFDPGSQFALQLIDSLSQQIGQGRQQAQEQQILDQLLPQIQQAENPQQILNTILQAQANTGLRPETQKNFLQAATPAFNLARDIVKKKEQGIQTEQDTKNFEDILVNFGIPRDQAKLWARSGAGAQTELLKNLLDQRARGGPPGFDNIGGINIPDENTEIDANPQDSFNFQFPNLPAEKGLTPKEIAKRRSDREKTNIPIFQEASKKFESLKDENRSIDRLQQLNDSGLLPQDLGRINVDRKTGDLVLPAAANAETQLFVKTVNDFLRKAKDTFGARVTNFEISAFLKRLPTLANSEEGRRLILKQMEIINELNALNEESIVQTFNNYGVENINFQQTKKIADQLKKEKQAILERRFKTLDGLLRQELKRNEQQPQEKQNLDQILFG